MKKIKLAKMPSECQWFDVTKLKSHSENTGNFTFWYKWEPCNICYIFLSDQMALYVTVRVAGMDSSVRETKTTVPALLAD